jgi:hypothetical protein
MDNKEILYEISLKYNTIKMYENTLNEMKKNGVASEEAIKKIEAEKNSAESELKELLDPKTKPVNENGYRTNPKINEDNEFLLELNKRHESRQKYRNSKSFFDEVTEEYEDEEPMFEAYDTPYNHLDEVVNKPRLAEIQDKISNSKWISSSNFILRFPKDEIDIDEWRVSSFFYYLSNPTTTKCSCNYLDDEDEQKPIHLSGSLSVTVNDFSEQINDYEYNVLTQKILDLYKNPVIKGDIRAEIIDNSGNLLYTIVFIKCVFNPCYSGGGTIGKFDYKNTDLHKIDLGFTFKDIIILAPNEDLKKEA